MSLFDYYLPTPGLCCPVCSRPLQDEWQGKDASCAMFVWRQGTAAPIAQRVDDDVRWADSELLRFRLPEKFEIYTGCCGGRFAVEAECVAVDGIWSTTTLVTAATARQRPGERRSDFATRMRWLRGTRADSVE